MSKPFPDFDPQLTPPPPGFSPRTSSAGALTAWLLVIAAVLALMNLSLNPILEGTHGPDDPGAWWGTFCMGSIGGQAGILAIAAVLGPSFALRRHLVVLPALAVLAMAWLLGFVISHQNHGYQFPAIRNVIAVMLVLPLMFCVCELPLWFFRTFLRWRIESPADGRARPPQLTISGILAATAAVALALGAVRLGHWLSGSIDEGEWWLAVAIAAAWCGGISLLLLPVVTALVFRTESLAIGLLVSAAWFGLLCFALFMVLIALFGPPPNTRELHLFVFVGLGFLATLLGPLALCRHFGYRLHWGRVAG